eukprot:364637-Chlamydomonas_euryale.AAC.14
MHATREIAPWGTCLHGSLSMHIHGLNRRKKVWAWPRRLLRLSGASERGSTRLYACMPVKIQAMAGSWQRPTSLVPATAAPSSPEQ